MTRSGAVARTTTARDEGPDEAPGSNHGGTDHGGYQPPGHRPPDTEQPETEFAEPNSPTPIHATPATDDHQECQRVQPAAR